MLQVLRGMYVLNDLRMLYWLVFVFCVYFSYIYFIDFQEKNKIDIEFVKYVFSYSSIYFFIYGVLGFFVKDPNDFQGIYWVGSSVAFIVLIPYLCSHFIIFRNSDYSLSGLNFINTSFVLIVVIIHHSRVGLYLFFLYFFLLLIQIAMSKPKKLLVVFSFVAFSVLAWDFSAKKLVNSPGLVGQISSFSVVTTDDYTVDKLEGDTGRFLMVQAIYNKSMSTPIDFIFGSGWYTARQTLKPYVKVLRNEYDLSTDHLKGDLPLQVITLAAIISDLGLVGLLFILFFFTKSSVQILKEGSTGRLIFLMFLMANWGFYLIGYTYVSVLSFLLFFPNGLLVCLSRVAEIPTKKINYK
jgi:hypothetical protein